MDKIREHLRSFYVNKVISIASGYLPLFVFVEHFTKSMLLSVIVFFVYNMIASFTPFDILINLIFGAIGCIFIFTDGFPIWFVVLYLALVIPKYVLFFLVVTMKDN